MFEEYTEEREIIAQPSELNDMEIWIRYEVDIDSQYNISGFGFEQSNGEVHWICITLWRRVLPRDARRQIRTVIENEVSDNPAIPVEEEGI